VSFLLNRNKGRNGFVDRDAALPAVGALILEIDPPSLKPSIICMRGVGFFMPCAQKVRSHSARGAISARTGFPRAFAKAAAIAFGVVRSAASSSTTWCPVHFSRSKSAATRPTSRLEIMAIG
jgi:hypothetical protein